MSIGMSFIKFGELMLKVQEKSYYGDWTFTFSKGQILALHKEYGEHRFESFVELEKWVNG